MKIKEPIGPATKYPWRYNEEHQTITINADDNPAIDGNMIADIRGWGWLQYLPDGAKIQDANGALIAGAGTVHHEMGMGPREMADEIRALAQSLQDMMYVYGTICDTQNWDRHHMAQYTAAERLLEKLSCYNAIFRG